MKRHLQLLIALVIAAACTDPVQSANEDAIPDDGKPDGPDHHVGSWCTACHSEHGSGPEFSVGGTVFVSRNSLTPAAGAIVRITDGDGKKTEIATYGSGNFYRTKEEYDPKYPLRIEIEYQGVKTPMDSLIGRDAGCGRCHSNTSAGDTSHTSRIYATPLPVNTDAGTDAGSDAAGDGGQ